MNMLRECLRVLRICWDGFTLRCPRCHVGQMFRGFQMYRLCPACDLQFETAAGEVTGGMGINIVVSGVFILAIAIGLLFFPAWPLWLAVGILAAFGVAFPIVFYPSSRGLWASFLYWSGNHAERDIHRPLQ